MRKRRISWDQYFMMQAILISSRATCPRLNVGAALVKHKSIIASGYNGSAAHDDHCIDVGCKLVNGHCVRTIHAEVNALTQCARFGEMTDGAEIYVTDFPCLNCTKMLIQAGIKKINYLRNYHNDEYVLELLKLNHVQLQQVKITKATLNSSIDILNQRFEETHSENVK